MLKKLFLTLITAIVTAAASSVIVTPATTATSTSLSTLYRFKIMTNIFSS